MCCVSNPRAEGVRKMAETTNNQRILELTTDIVITAMETGRLDAGNAEAVAEYCYAVACRMYEASCIDDQVVAAAHMKRREV